MNAADKIIALIENAKLSYYAWEGIYEDIPEKIKYTLKDGVVFGGLN